MSGNVSEAAPARVNPGDTIFGYLFHLCSRGTLSCPTWYVATYDVTSGKGSYLNATSSYGQTFNWAFSGVLEVYNVTQCGDYPAKKALTFYDVTVADYNFSPVEPAWSVNKASSALVPQCSYNGALAQQTTLYY
jgi:hypothetical protein